MESAERGLGHIAGDAAREPDGAKAVGRENGKERGDTGM
jgi:hypothetical protein